MAVSGEKKEVTSRTDSISLQRKKEEIKARNVKVLTESKKQRLKDAKLVK